MKSFPQAVEDIYKEDSRFHPDSYEFLNDALSFTVNRILDTEKQQRHISGAELAFGFRDYTLQEFGPMSKPLLKEWGITKTRDIGDMVFSLINEKIFSKEEGDSPEDFNAVYSFKDAFEKPFLPLER